MQSVFALVCLVYYLLIANFYKQSNGFQDHYNLTYAFWKITPILFLAGFTFLHGGGMKRRYRLAAAGGLIFGGIGDWIIGIDRDGIIPGAIAFGIGHLFYLSIFIRHRTQLHNRAAVAMLIWAAIIGQLCLLPLMRVHFAPVLIFSIYSVLLSVVTVIAVSQYLNGSKTQDERALFYRAIGFGLFYASDSFLILTHTGHWSFHSDLLVLATYYQAQLLILYANSIACNRKCMFTPSQSLAIYGGTAFLAYIETSGYEKEKKVLLSLPFLVLSLLTLATTMHPKPRFATAASFLVMATATYAQSSLRTTAPFPALLITVANLLYYLSYRDLVTNHSKPVIVLSVIVTFGVFVYVLRDVVVAIPYLAAILMTVFISHILLISTAASVCQYGQHGDYDARQASMVRLIGAILAWLSSLLFFINAFQTHTRTVHTVSRVLIYLANSLLYISNERAF
ncbi:unnamed protein product [Caenorhabditis bovis]|uniref:lysoplasmalogenase n=1 Tax=Caenorhabditis bovis TaxID=2654633 RepID=A0A8S1EV22_9PELO|nr:unnamed protein product [Caenorhabditis bovis]